MENLDSFGARLRWIIKLQGSQQNLMAKELGVAVTTLRGWISGQKQPNLANIAPMIEVDELRPVVVWLLFGRSLPQVSWAETGQLPRSKTELMRDVLNADAVQEAPPRRSGLNDDERALLRSLLDKAI